MTIAELKAELDRIRADLILIPTRKRYKWLKKEIATLPPECRDFIFQFFTATEVIIRDDLNVKTSTKQIATGLVCIAVGTVLAFCFRDPTGIQYLFLRGFFVLGVSGIAVGILVGTVNLKWSFTKSLVVTATGGFAILILFYFANPPPPPSAVPKQTQTIPTNTVNSR